MKKMLSVALLMAGAFTLQQVQAACDYPIAPGKFPDGNVATLDEMKVAKAQTVKYDADMAAYLVCIRSEFDARLAAQTDVTDAKKAEQERMHVQKEEAALSEVKDVVARFNEQREIYVKKNPKKKS